MKIIDLSMEVHMGMIRFPRIAPTIITELENHRQFAEGIGADKFGVKELTNHYLILMSDHAGTHLDSWQHANPKAPISAEKIPLEYCYGNGVILDLSHKKPGEEISVIDLENALGKIAYKIKPLDIVLIRTDASRRHWGKQEYLTEHPGMTEEGTLWLLDQGVKVAGIDAVTFDLPMNTMLRLRKYWPAHLVMKKREYYHLENLMNLYKVPVQHGFKFACFPIKIRGTSASPVRAVAILE